MNEWISVSERMPDECASVAGLNDRFDARYAGHFEAGTFYSDESGDSPIISHWCPLPEPPA